MSDVTKKLLRGAMAWTTMASAALAISACSPPPAEDPCEDVTCVAGVCSEGECVNPDSCEESADCLPGYDCGADGACQAAFACDENDECARGTCADGACINPISCGEDSECRPDSYCSEGECVADGCYDQEECDRGVCERSSGECVDKETCEADTDCLDGKTCYEGACSTDEQICDALDCQRGICNIASLSCIDANDCGGDDANCLEGNYCDGTECKENACDDRMEDCPRGVCDQSSGECVNPGSCQSSDDCLDMNLCVGNACVPAADACAAAPCEGNQECIYDDVALSASCQENTGGCDDARDCLGDRVCSGGSCADPAAACEDDANEDNDDAANATTYANAVVGKSIQARTCAGDEDVYFIDTSDAQVPGQLVMELDMAREDIGLGQLEVELFNEDGSISLGKATTSADGRARLVQRISFATRLPYTIVVRGVGQLSTDGIDYRLFAQVIDESILNACDGAPVLTEGMGENGNTLSGDSLAMSAACADSSGTLPEDTWLIELDEPSYVTVTVAPQAGVDLAVSIREECVNATSEASCSDDATEGGRETAEALLSAGTHAVIVQTPKSAGSGGGYSISYTASPTICGPDFAECSDADTARACGPNGTSIVNVECGMRGCDMNTGRCARLDGDVCSQPVLVDASAGPYTGRVEWVDLNNTYAIAAGNCVQDDGDGGVLPVSGPDSAFQVTVPAGHGVRATLDYAGQDISLYAVTSCDQLAGTCLDGANESVNQDETLFWQNDGAQDQDIFIIADVIASAAYTPSSIEIEVAEVICSPDASTCSTDMTGQPISQRCDQFGFDYSATKVCNYGCDAGTGECNPPGNDACSGAEVLTDGVPATANIGDFVSDHPLTDGTCTGFPTAGPDAIYTIDANQDDIVTVEFSSPFDGAAWVSTSCDMGQMGACLQGVDDAGTNGTEVLEFVAPQTGTYYISVLAFSRTSGNFTLTATAQAPQCSPGDPFTCSSGTDVQYCNDRGLFETYTCQTTCTNGACDQPTGDLCIDPIKLSGATGELLAQSFGTKSTNDIQVDPGRSGACFVDSSQGSSGREDVFAVDLAAGDLLEATLTTAATTAHLFVFEDCLRTDTCAANLPFQGSGSLSYYAETARTVTLVVDYRGNTPPSQTYDLAWEVSQGKACAPGKSFCADGQRVSMCNEDGSAVVYTQTCPGDCVDGGCAIEPGTNDLCADASAATSVGDGISVFGVYSQLQNDIDLGTGNCTGGSTAGPEALYKVTVPAGQLLRARGVSFGKESATVYAFRDCADASGSCVAGAGESGSPASAELLYLNSSASDEDLIVAIDSRFATADEPFGLEIAVEPTECSPGEQRCAANGTDLEICGVFGLYETTPCTNGCSADACQMPTGDTCAESFELARAGGTVTGVLWPGSNDATLSRGRTGACLLEAATSGPEVFYRIQLNAGEMLTTQLDTDYPDTHIYVLPTCDALDQCLSATTGEGDGTTIARYVAPVDQTVRVVIDTEGASATDTFDLTWSLTPGVPCAPGQSRCIDDSTVGVCDLDGIVETNYPCDGACSNGACAIDSARDVCADASTEPAIVGGASISGSFNQFATDSVDLPSSGSCVSDDTPGDDTFYRVTIGQGETLKATLRSFDSEIMALYLLSDCAAPDTSCVAGNVAASSSESAVLTYTNTSQQVEVLTLGVDSTSSAANGDFSLLIDIKPPECLPGQRICSANGYDQKSCGPGNVFESFTCNGTCTGTACDNPTGDVCLDAITLSGLSGSVSGDWTTGTNSRQLNVGETGDCAIDDGDQSDGFDDFYRVPLNAGDVLNVDLQTGSSTAYLMLFEGCGPSQDTCSYVNPLEANVIGTSYYASSQTEVILVVDNTSTTTTDEYTLTWRIGQGQLCAPNTTRCIDDTTLAVCDNLGNESNQSCAQGCNVNACNNDPSADACDMGSTALVGDGISVFGRYDELDDDTYTLASNDCAGITTSGNDAVYAMELQPNEGLTAQLRGYGGFEDPILYAFTDCMDPSGSCVAGENNSDNDFVTNLDVVNDSGSARIYYVVIDSESSGADEAFHFTMTKLRPDCAAPGQVQCGNDNLTLRICGDDGFYDRYLCDGGCAGSSCGQPRGEICADSVALTGTSGSFQQMNWVGNSSIQFTTDNSGGCLLPTNTDTDGPDAFYTVTLGAGDLLRARLSTGESDARMFLISDCADSGSCIATSETSGSGELFHRSETGGTFTLVVDVEGSTSERYSLDYEVISGFTCEPGGARCVDAATLAVCRNGGSSEQLVACNCQNDACVAVPGDQDVCADASAGVDVGDGIRVSGLFEDLTETITIPSSGCAAVETDGTDAFYKVELAPGQSVIAKARSYSSFDVALYAFTDCADAENTCLQGSQGADESAEIVYTNPAGAAGSQTVFIALDTTSPSATGRYTLDIERRGVECTSGQIQCAADQKNIQLCNDQGYYDYFLCSDSCTLPSQCNNPSGEACYEAQVLSSLSGTLTGDFGGTDTFSLPSGRSGGCFVDDSTLAIADGPDTFYQITLAQSDLLTLDLQSDNDDAVLYILRGCNANQCIENLTSPGTLTYYASELQETIFIGVDTTSASTETFTLDYTVVTGAACEPGGSRCVDANTLEICSNDGLGVVGQVNCPGGCADGRCELDTATADICSDAVALGAVGVGMTVNGNFAQLTDDISLPTSACVGDDTPGPDAFYRIDVPTGQILVARATSYGAENTAVYAITDCANPDLSCVGGVEGSLTTDAQLRYLNSSGSVESLVVAVDSDNSSADELFSLDVRVTSPVCSPGARTCSSANDLQVCDGLGLFADPFRCEGGCVNGACGNPQGDQCFDAIPVNPLGGPVTFSETDVNINDQTNQMSLGSGSCLGSSGDGDGEERFYQVILAPGETVTANMSTNSFEDMELYIITDCTRPAQTCVSGTESGGTNITEVQSYTNNTGVTETVTVVADFDDTFAFGDFDISIVVQ